MDGGIRGLSDAVIKWEFRSQNSEPRREVSYVRFSVFGVL